MPPEAQDAFFITLDKLDKIGWDGVRAELAELGFDPARVAAAAEKIQGLTGVPADRLANALADSVPGLAPHGGGGPRRDRGEPGPAGFRAVPEVAVRSDAGPRDGVLHRARSSRSSTRT